MDKLKAGLASGVTALWLTLSTGCATAEGERIDSGGVHTYKGSIPSSEVIIASDSEQTAVKINDPSLYVPSADVCVTGLVDLLVTREIYENLQDGTSLSVDAKGEEKPLAEQVSAYKAQRVEELSKVFCDPEKPELTELANALAVNPMNVDDFKKLQVTLVSEHMTALKENYTFEDFRNVVSAVGDFALNVNNKAIELLEPHFDHAAYDEKLEKMASDYYERFVVLAVTADMADLFDTDVYLTEKPADKLQSEISGGVRGIITSEIISAAQRKQDNGPLQQASYSF